MSSSLKRPRSPQQHEENPSQIHISPPITDRASTFLAHFSPTLSAQTLQSHPSLRTATHRIAAWRRPTSQRTLGGRSNNVLLESGHDDDGEKGAGARLERVMAATLGAGEAGAVVVARWYGGVMLGPVRFAHVERCAREAIAAWRGPGKRRKIEDGAPQERSREEMERVLGERDRSVEVLRGLLAEKKRVVGREGVAPAAVPRKAVDYKGMSVQVLGKLEKARDATIAFILKELDQVEDEILKAMGDEEEDQDDGSKAPGPETAESPGQKEEVAETVADQGSNDVAAPGVGADDEHKREQSKHSENSPAPSHGTIGDAG